jgi:hypothetical protein
VKLIVSVPGTIGQCKMEKVKAKMNPGR